MSCVTHYYPTTALLACIGARILKDTLGLPSFRTMLNQTLLLPQICHPEIFKVYSYIPGYRLGIISHNSKIKT